MIAGSRSGPVFDRRLCPTHRPYSSLLPLGPGSRKGACHPLVIFSPSRPNFLHSPRSASYNWTTAKDPAVFVLESMNDLSPRILPLSVRSAGPNFPCAEEFEATLDPSYIYDLLAPLVPFLGAILRLRARCLCLTIPPRYPPSCIFSSAHIRPSQGVSGAIWRTTAWQARGLPPSSAVSARS